MEKNNPLLWTMALTALGTVNAVAQTDVTDKITNADFAGTNTECAGWTLSGFNGNAENCLESYQGAAGNSYNLKQKITLPAGNYRLVGYAFYRQGGTYNAASGESHAFMVVGSRKIPVRTLASESVASYPNSMAQANQAFQSGLYRNEVVFSLDKEQEVEIGFEGTHVNDNKNSWFIVGSVKLFSCGVDATSEVANAGFESDFDGWVNSGFQRQQNTSFPSKVGTYYCEKWDGNNLADADIHQEVALPDGIYSLSAVGAFGGSGFSFYAGDKDVAVTSEGYYTIENIEVTGGKLTIGARIKGATSNWARFDDVRLTLSETSLEVLKKELTQKIAVAINKANVDSSDESIREALIKLSGLQLEVNLMTFAQYKACKNDEAGNFVEQIAELDTEISKAVANKKQYDAAINSYKSLEGAKAELDAAYNAADENAQTACKTLYEDAVGAYENFMTECEDAYNKGTAGTLFSDSSIDEKIKALEETLSEATNAIKSGNQNYIDYVLVDNAITRMLSVYADASATLYRELSDVNNDVYGDMYTAALVELNAIKRNITAVENANEEGKTTTDEALTCSALKDKHIAALAAAEKKINELVEAKVTKADELKANYKLACEDMNTLTDAVTATLDGEKETDFQEVVSDIKADIAALQAKVDAANKAHIIKGETPFCDGYDTDKAAIEKKISEVLAVKVAEFKANAKSMKTIEDLQAKFNTAKSNPADKENPGVNELVSADDKYVVNGIYADTETAIQKEISDYSAAAAKAYGEGKAGEYNKTLNVSGTEAKIDTYFAHAKEALAKYEEIAGALKADNEALAELKGLVADRGDVTVGASTADGAVTYGKRIEELTAAIATAQKALDAAIAKKDVEHYTEMMNLTVNTAIASGIAELKDAYEDDKSAWDAKQQELAQERMCAEADALIAGIKLPEEYTKEEYGLKADELETERQKIVAAVETIKGEIESARQADVADAIAILPEIIAKIKAEEANAATLEIKAGEILAEFEAEQEAKAVKDAAIKNLNEQLNGRAKTKTEAEIIGVANLNKDTNKTADFAKEISDLQTLIDALTAEVGNSFAAETLRKDNKDEVIKEEGKDEQTVPGYDTRVDDLNTKVAALRSKAEAATANWNAYNELKKYVADSKVAETIAVAKEGVKVATGDTLTHYQTIITGYENRLGTETALGEGSIWEAIDKAYNPKKYDSKSTSEGDAVAQKAAIISRIDDLKGEASKLPADAKANEDAYNALEQAIKGEDLTSKTAGTEFDWNAVYTKVSTEAEVPVDALENAMSKLAAAKKGIEELKQKVSDTHANGTCSENQAEMENTLSDINSAIKTVSDGWTSDYNEAVAAYNKETKDAFDNKLQELKDEYSDVTNLISKVSKTSYAADFVETLQEVTGEGGIYTYPELIRDLQSKAETAYAAVQPGEVFDIDKTFEKTATQYINNIKELSDSYTDKVNEYANEVYAEAYAVTEAKYNAAVESIKHFKDDVKTVALTDVKTILDDSKVASGQPDFAIKLDAILAKFDMFDTYIAADKEKAANGQYAVVIAELEALTASEAKDIAGFHSVGGELGASSGIYAELVENSLTAAKKAYAEKTEDQTYFDLVTGKVRACIEVLTGTYTQLEVGKDKDGKPVYETHTQLYVDAYNENKEFDANDTAWRKDMLVFVDDAQSALDELKTYVKSLVIAYNVDVNGVIDGYQTSINLQKSKADNAHENNSSTIVKDAVVNALNQVKVEIAASYKDDVVPQEYNSIVTAVATLKHDYGLAAATDIDNSAIDGYKVIIDEYAAKNEVLRSEFVNGKKSENGVVITDKDKNIVYATWQETYEGYLALEKCVATTRDELAEIYDNKLAGNVKSALDEQLGKVEDEYNAIRDLLATCHTPVVDEFQADADAMKVAIDAERAHIQADADAKTILLYEENHGKDIAAIAAEYDGLKAKIEEMERPYDVNDVAYARLTAEIEVLQERLDAVNAVAAEYKYQDRKKYWVGTEGEEGYVEFDSYREYGYDIISNFINADRARIETLNAQGRGLKENTQLRYKGYVEGQTDKLENILAAYNAEHLITELSNELQSAKDEFGRKVYTNEDWTELYTCYQNINSVIENLNNYNSDAKDGSVSKDIDGNLIYIENPTTGKEKPGAKDVKYIDAYAEVYAKYLTVSDDIKAFASDVDEKSYILGDVNHDGKVNMIDYTIARNILLEVEGLEVTEGMRFAADVNGDNDVNVGDLTKIANYIMTGNFGGTVETLVRSRYSTHSSDALTLAVEGTGAKQRIVIGLANSVEYVAGQMDVKLPAGVRLLDESLSTRANGHELFSNEVNGAHRILVSTTDNYALLDGEQALVYLDVEVSADYAGGAIEVTNVVFADADAHTYKLNTVKGEGDATGITELNTAEKVVSRIYTVGGQMVKSLQKGVNIIINSDGTTRKVLKK